MTMDKERKWHFTPLELPEINKYGISREVLMVVRHIANPEAYPPYDENFCGFWLGVYSLNGWKTRTGDFRDEEIIAWTDLPAVPMHVEKMLNEYGMSLAEGE